MYVFYLIQKYDVKAIYTFMSSYNFTCFHCYKTQVFYLKSYCNLFLYLWCWDWILDAKHVQGSPA